MATILKEVKISGNTLMKNHECEVVVKPSNTGEIRMYVEGADKYFVAKVDNVIATDHCVVLGSKEHRTLLGGYKYQVMLCEHFMAACGILGINSIDVYVSKPEFPALDGSSKQWVELFRRAGITKEKRSFYTVSEPVYYLNGKTSLVVLPDKELTLSYAVNYDFPDLTRQWVPFNEKNIDEIIEARTFGFYRDLKKFQMLGFARGVNAENTLGLMDDGTYSSDLRSKKEPIKHKILDLFGDFYLTGVSILDMKAQILVKEAGHAVHIKVAKELKDKLIKIK